MEEQFEAKIKEFLKDENWKDFINEQMGDIDNSTLIGITISNINDMTRQKCTCSVDVSYTVYGKKDGDNNRSAKVEYRQENSQITIENVYPI
jgi:hypothetical protein